MKSVQKIQTCMHPSSLVNDDRQKETPDSFPILKLFYFLKTCTYLNSNIGNCAIEYCNYSIALLFLKNWDI